MTHHEHNSGHTHHGESMAISATLHCLTGCAIGEVLGLVIGTIIGLATLPTIVLAVGLAFVFGYGLSTLPLLNAGLRLRDALKLVLAADTLSIATMELVDNGVMALIPGAMEAGLNNPLFWLSMPLALCVAFFAAWPVNAYLLRRNQGHALVMPYHHGHVAQRRIRVPSTTNLIVGLAAFFAGGLLVSLFAAVPMTTH